MSDGSLSQDEIDALLQGTDTIEMDTAPAAAPAAGLTEQERVGFQNLLRDVVESQSSNLGMLIGKTVRIDPPTVQVVAPGDLAADLDDQLVEVKIDFNEGVSGDHSYLLTADAATRIASLMMGQESIELDDVAYSTLGEAISNITGPTATAIGNQIDSTVQTAVPVTRKVGAADISIPAGEAVVRVEYPLTIEGDMPTRLVELYAVPIVKEVVSQSQPAPAPRSPAAAPAARRPGPAQGFGAPQQGYGQPFGGFGMGSSPPSVQPVQFASLQGGAPPPGGGEHRPADGRLHGDDRRVGPHAKAGQGDPDHRRRLHHRAGQAGG